MKELGPIFIKPKTNESNDINNSIQLGDKKVTKIKTRPNMICNELGPAQFKISAQCGIPTLKHFK